MVGYLSRLEGYHPTDEESVLEFPLVADESITLFPQTLEWSTRVPCSATVAEESIRIVLDRFDFMGVMDCIRVVP